LPKETFTLALEQNLVGLFDWLLRPQVCLLSPGIWNPVLNMVDEGMMSMALLDRVVWVDPDSMRVRCRGFAVPD
jgi:hypothetical protein